MRRTSAVHGSSPGGETSQWQTMKRLLPYLWPAGRLDLKICVIIALVLLVGSKLVTVVTPYAFKAATDALAQKDGAMIALLAVPVFMVLAYGVGRILMVVFAQLRDAIFSKVGQRAVRELSYATFRHLHQLSLSFHLGRRTGALSRIISRGINGVDFVLRFALFNTFPTALEIALVCGVIAYSFGHLYVWVVAITVVAYVGFTYWATERRIGIRRDMNEADNDAGTKAIDSLLNFETVKYFGNERHEADRYDFGHGPLRNGGHPYMGLTGRAQRRAGHHLFHWSHHRHGDGGARNHWRYFDHRRLCHDQRSDDPALHATQFHWLLLS